MKTKIKTRKEIEKDIKKVFVGKYSKEILTTTFLKEMTKEIADWFIKESADIRQEAVLRTEMKHLLEEEYGDYCLVLSISIMDEKNRKKYKGVYTIDLWFNDMFGWATSYAMTFVPKKNSDIFEICNEFSAWMNKSGEKLMEQFDTVKYPYSEDKTYEKDLENYFKQNWKIGKKLEKSIDKYCGRVLNNE